MAARITRRCSRTSRSYSAAPRSAEIRLRAIADDTAAQHERFLGSPTVRVDGRDVEPGAQERDDFGLKCRLYRTPAGLRGAPPDQWILDALTRKLA